MPQIFCVVDHEAKQVLLDWQEKKDFRRQDMALQDLLITFRDEYLEEL